MWMALEPGKTALRSVFVCTHRPDCRQAVITPLSSIDDEGAIFPERDKKKGE